MISREEKKITSLEFFHQFNNICVSYWQRLVSSLSEWEIILNCTYLSLESGGNVSFAFASRECKARLEIICDLITVPNVKFAIDKQEVFSGEGNDILRIGLTLSGCVDVI